MPSSTQTINNKQLTIDKKVKSHLSNVTCEVKPKGFTIIELLVVIAIIGILSAFGYASITSAQAKARDSDRKSDLDALKKALELAKSDSTGGYYPAAADSTNLVTPEYIKEIPTDPKGAAAYTYTATPASCTTACTKYTLTACLENNNEPVGGPVKTKPGSGDGSTCSGTKIYQITNP